MTTPTILLDTLLAKLSDRSARVVVMGQGYVGLPVAMRAVEAGLTTVGFDIDSVRIEALRDGRSFVGDISDDEVARGLATSYVPTDDAGDLAGFDVAVISVPTPLRDHLPDLSAIEQAGALLAPHMRPGCCIILESTTYPGTTTELLGPILAAGSGLTPSTDFFLGYSPERIDPGNPRWNLVNTPKVVSGADDGSLAAVDAFFSLIVDRTVPVHTCEEAETVKLLENTFRHVNIALVNELAVFAHQLDIDIWNVIDAASTKPFGYMRFTPGPGVGGHCLPVDPSYLSWRVRQHLGRPFRFVELANEVNEHMPDHVLERLVRLLNDAGRSMRDSTVLLLGLAYKAGTSDWRESPTVPLAEKLAEWGAHVRLCDPHVVPESAQRLGYPLVEFSDAQLAEADLVVVMVDHPEFEPDRVATHARLVFDAKGTMRSTAMRGERL